jgi:hypothetical protein
MRICRYLYLLTPLLILTSCIKDDFTKPAEVTFTFRLNSEELDGKFLEFQGGTMYVKEIGFEGYRESGEDVFFNSDFENLIMADLATGATTDLIKFDIPQGIYDHINLSIEIDQNNEDPSLTLNGAYNSANHGFIPVRFEFGINEILNLNPKPGKGKNKIVLNKDIPSNAEVLISTGFLFQVVNSRMLESAEIIQQNGESMIVISKDLNQHIFNVVVNRLEKSTSALFN